LYASLYGWRHPHGSQQPPLATNPSARYTVHMSKPTGIRLDDTTRARAEAVKARAQVPVTTSAVLQEAIRRGLDAMEFPQYRIKLLGGDASWRQHGKGWALQAFGKRAIVQQVDGDWTVYILLWRDGQWTEIDSDCGSTQKWALDYGEAAVFAIAKEWRDCDPL